MSNSKERLVIMKYVSSLAVTAVAGLAVILSGVIVTPDDAFAKRKRSRDHKSNIAQSVVKLPTRPLVVVVSLARQRVTVFDGENVVRRAPISSGARGHRTPRGVFSIIQKRRHHFSNLYNNAPMPFMQRITWSGIALHEGRLPGYPASHGCIRLPRGFARGLFKMTSMGTRIIVARDMHQPRMFQHDALFKPLPFDVPASAEIASAAGATPAAQDAMNAPASGGALSISSVVGVPPASAADAAAATAPSSRQALGDAGVKLDAMGAPRLTRRQFEAARTARKAQLKASLGTTKNALKEAGKTVAQRRLALREARKTAAAAKRHVRKLKRAAAKARKQAKRATRALLAFEKRYSGKTFDAVEDAVVLAKATAREDSLEARYFERIEDAEVARIDAQDMQKHMASSLQSIGQAKEDLGQSNRDAKMALIAYNRAKDEMKSAIRAEKRYNKPISIFISRRTGKLYIRQGYAPIYETPVTIAEPDRPFGTHVFTALQFNENKTELSWSVVSIADDGRKRSRRSRKKKAPQSISYPRQRPDEVLERINISEEARYEVAKLIKPGSSLIISDRRKSNETGKYTDFIVSLN